jgi:hypothetical protein
MKPQHSENTGLFSVLSSNRSAQEYFGSLPDYVQGMLQQHTYEIQSEEDLRKYAEVFVNSMEY